MESSVYCPPGFTDGEDGSGNPLRVDGGVTRTQSLEWNQPHILAVTGAYSYLNNEYIYIIFHYCYTDILDLLQQCGRNLRSISVPLLEKYAGSTVMCEELKICMLKYL